MELSPRHRDIIHGKMCPYCNAQTMVMSEEHIYGRSYKGRAVICCANFPHCDSYVGTHDDGSPLGRLANKPLRLAKKNAHAIFDRLWREKHMDRDTAYEQLADHLQLPDEFTHIGMFGIETCRKVEVWAKAKLKALT